MGLNNMASTENNIIALESQAEILQTLAQIAEQLNATLDLDEILRRVADLIKKVMDYEIFAIMLVNERTQRLRFRFAIGHREEVVKNWQVPLGQGITGTAALTRQAVLVPDVTLDPRYINALDSVRSELAIPLLLKGRCIGVLDIQSVRLNYFTEEQRNILSLLASRIAIAIENARLYRKAVRQARTLSVLNEISREISSILNLEELLKKVADLLKRLVDYYYFSILLWDERDQVLRHRISVKRDEQLRDKRERPLGQGIVGITAATRQPISVPDVHKDPRYIAVNPETNSEMAIPLVLKDRLIGVMDLESPEKDAFTEDQRNTLMTLAGQLAVAIENARLYEKVARDEARLEKDLEMAREMQSALLPQTPPSVRGLHVGVGYEPARTLGGDLYDFLEYPDGALGIAVGDVSGKGTAAALSGAQAIGILRSLGRRRYAPHEMLRLMNDALCRKKIEAHFISLCYAVWDPRRRELRLSNAGLPYPLIYQRGKVEHIRVAGVPLGLMDATQYEERAMKLFPGDVVVIYSDGVVESTNRRRGEFGQDRLKRIIAENRRLAAGKLAEMILASVGRFARRVMPQDDRALVVLKHFKE